MASQDNAQKSFDQEVDDSFQEVFGEIKKSLSSHEEPPHEEDSSPDNEEIPEDNDSEPVDENSEIEAEPEPEPAKKESSKKENKKHLKESIFELKQDKYRVLEAKAKLEEDNRKLRELLEQSVYQGAFNYGKNALSELEKAIESKKRAISDGDMDMLIQADIEINRAQRKVDDLETSTSNNSYEPEGTQAAEDDGSFRPDVVQLEMAKDWVAYNPEINPSSPYYNAELAKHVSSFTNYMEQEMIKSGDEKQIYTPRYFRAVEDFIADMKQKSGRQENRQEISPRRPVQNVASVSRGNGHSDPSSNKIRITLTEGERRMAKNMGVSEKDWLRNKIDLNRSR